MGHSFLVLHFGVQCPWQPWVVEQARLAAEKLGGTEQVVDATHRPELATLYKLFWPFMTVIDEKIRLPSPTPVEELVRIATEGEITALPIPETTLGPEAESDRVLSLTASSIADSCSLCNRADEQEACLAKTGWAADITCKVPEGILGFIAYDKGEAAGAVEFLPSPLVPYPLPEKSNEIAFITCIYSFEEGADYRGQVLKHLLNHLQDSSYRELQVVAGQRSPYPNGPEPFFRKYGFEPVAELDRVILREGEERVILMKLALK
jgi:hypothetical protein